MLDDPAYRSTTTTSQQFSTFGAYARSKLANIWMVLSLRKRGADAVALHPGNITSEVTRGLTFWLRVADYIGRPISPLIRKSCAAGARCQVYLATTKVPPRALYYVHSAPAPHSSDAGNEDLAEQYWALSEAWCGGGRDDNAEGSSAK